MSCYSKWSVNSFLVCGLMAVGALLVVALRLVTNGAAVVWQVVRAVARRQVCAEEAGVEGHRISRLELLEQYERWLELG